MSKRIKVKANAMEDASVRFVSLVERPASRLPFRVLKHDEPDQENGLMINLSRMFKRDGDATNVGVTLVGVVLQKEHRDHFAPELEKLGLKTDDVVEGDDGVLIFRQSPFDTDSDEVVAIKLNELGGLFTNVPEKVTKAFDMFPESNDFDENMKQAGFLPGLSVATEVLMETVHNVLRSSDDPGAARSGLDSALSAYSSAILDLADELPSVAFKMEALTLEGYEPAAETEDKVEKEDEKTEEPAEAEVKDTETQAETETDVAKDDAATEEATADNAQAEADALKAKGVHIEGDGATDIKNPSEAETEASTEPEGDKPADVVEKSEESEPAIDALVAKMSEVLEAISGVRSEVADLKESNATLTEKVKGVEETAEAARKAVKGTVPSSSDTDDRVDESLGTHSRRQNRSKAEHDEQAWGGTSLDRIVGDFGS